MQLHDQTVTQIFALSPEQPVEKKAQREILQTNYGGLKCHQL